MTDLTDKVDAIADGLRLDGKAVALRKALLELTPEDDSRLRRAHYLVQDQISDLTDVLFEHLRQFEPLQHLLQGDERLERLKAGQTRYFETLTAGEYGPDYIRERLRVGLVHQQIGLTPNWYLGAYRKYFAQMQKLLWEVLGHEPDEFLKTCDALSKVVNFDIGLALDTYFQADTDAIREYKEYGESIFAAMPIGLMVVSANHIVLAMNPAMHAMLRLKAGRSGVGVPLSALIKNSLLLGACSEAIETGVPQQNIFVSFGAETNRLKLDFSLRCIKVRGKTSLLLTAQDITAIRRVEAELAQSEERYRLTFDLAAVGMAQADNTGRITRINKKMCDILGYEKDELLGVRLAQLTEPQDREDIQMMMNRVLQGSLESYSKERRYLHKAGHVVWSNVTVSCLRDGDNRIGLVVILEDISARKHMEQELVHMASHDTLTGLLNRILLQDRLVKAVAQARRNYRSVAVLYLDMDNFKHVNESQGHAAGDAMLAESARRLLKSVRETDTVARLGGDEFVVVLENLHGSHEAGAKAQQILSVLLEPFIFKGQSFHIGASIGIAMYSKDGADADTLLKHANSAMYQAKEAGRANVQFYTAELNALYARRVEIADGLRQVLDNNELHLNFQPKVVADDGRVVGAEVLLRWTRQDGSIVGPDEFIPVAEEIGLIQKIGAWVLQQACSQIMEWREIDSSLRISVNMSAHQLKSPDIVQVVKSALVQAQCPPDALELEITESVLMEHPEKTTIVLQTLHDMGVRLSIDDFGTGYSSLSYLRNFPIHELKIDRSFVDDITSDESHAAIVNAIIHLAHNLKLTVVAEGVETPEQLRYLRAQKCDYLQGYLLSRPVPAQELSDLLTVRLP